MFDGYVPSRFHVIYSAPIWMARYESALLYSLTVGLAPSRVLEIGTFKGGAAVVMCAALDDIGQGRVVSVDPAPRIEEETAAAIRHRVTTVVAEPLPESLAKARELAGGPFELALIDREPSREAVEADIEATLAVLSDEAHLLLHDAHFPEVRAGIDAAVERHAGTIDDAGLISRGHSAGDDGARWGGLRLLRYRR